MSSGRPTRLQSSLVTVLVGTMLWLVTPAYSQGFMVKPMKVEIIAKPGEAVTAALDLQNKAADGAKILDLKLVQLGQAPSGAWDIVEGNATTRDAVGAGSSDASCFSWLSLSATSINVDALKTETVQIKLKIPASASGVYYAGVIAQTRPPADAKGLKVVVRFLIPVVVEIQGRPERQKIDFKDLEMAVAPKAEGKPLSTIVNAVINNDGRTYSRIKGNIKLMYQTRGHWQSVATADIREIGVMPGSKLSLPCDLSRGLPSGKYKLTGTVYVDGRRLKPIEKEIDFKGDPSITKLTVDTALLVEPAEILVTGTPGAVRTTSIKIENTSEEAVEVVAAAIVPQPLRGVALGDIKGDDFCCAGWLEVTPAKFTLRPGGKQNLRLTAKMPADAKDIPAYFTTLSLKATYPDGQSAGETQATMIVDNKKVDARPAAQVMKFAVVAGDANQYIVQVRFGNTGNSRYMPKGVATVLGDGGKAALEASISGMETHMMPLETRDGSTVLDFAKVEAGNYILKVVMDCGTNQPAVEQMPLVVTIENGQRVVTLAGTAATAPATEPATKPATAPAGK